mmetsp:Transcript_92270/g.223962  ORF Transcript_92270/g.223962 Transcript_92270/m.223962 type:complete len:283 (-) Transcript_92270:588-1436(-)
MELAAAEAEVRTVHVLLHGDPPVHDPQGGVHVPPADEADALRAAVGAGLRQPETVGLGPQRGLPLVHLVWMHHHEGAEVPRALPRRCGAGSATRGPDALHVLGQPALAAGGAEVLAVADQPVRPWRQRELLKGFTHCELREEHIPVMARHGPLEASSRKDLRGQAPCVDAGRPPIIRQAPPARRPPTGHGHLLRGRGRCRLPGLGLRQAPWHVAGAGGDPHEAPQGVVFDRLGLLRAARRAAEAQRGPARQLPHERLLHLAQQGLVLLALTVHPHVRAHVHL